MTLRETKIFDPADGFGSIADLVEITDATLARRDRQWWMYCAGQRTGFPSTQLFGASLPLDHPLSAQGWSVQASANDPTKVATLAGHTRSSAWDLSGGRHCPCWVRGWDPMRGEWVERIYYAGSAGQIGGPYTIGFLAWDGAQWVDQPAPAFVASEAWDHGSVFEPNVLYADGKWKMWYAAGSNFEDYIVQGYSESADGVSGWSEHTLFAAPDYKMFDFSVARTAIGYEAVYSRIWLAGTPTASETGLWWSRADNPSSSLADWTAPIQIMTARDRGWHSGPWKPSLQLDDRSPDRRFVFFDGSYRTDDPGPFPFAFTLGCLEFEAGVAGLPAAESESV